MPLSAPMTIMQVLKIVGGDCHAAVVPFEVRTKLFVPIGSRATLLAPLPSNKSPVVQLVGIAHVSVPEVVTGEPLITIPVGAASPTLVTFPLPVAGTLNIVRSSVIVVIAPLEATTVAIGMFATNTEDEVLTAGAQFDATFK